MRAEGLSCNEAPPDSSGPKMDGWDVFRHLGMGRNIRKGGVNQRFLHYLLITRWKSGYLGGVHQMPHDTTRSFFHRIRYHMIPLASTKPEPGLALEAEMRRLVSTINQRAHTPRGKYGSWWSWGKVYGLHMVAHCCTWLYGVVWTWVSSKFPKSPWFLMVLPIVQCHFGGRWYTPFSILHTRVSIENPGFCSFGVEL